MTETLQAQHKHGSTGQSDKPITRNDTECEKDHWTLDDIDWHGIDTSIARHNHLTRYVVTAASFIETAADLYTANLVRHFPDPDAQSWLANHWQPEELQHGLALRTYVQTAWPELDWPGYYDQFFAEYSQLCTLEELEPSPALEMVARCVVEAGTSTFYTTLQNFSDEPVLKTLTAYIRQDEVNHYRHFRRFFEKYRHQEQIGRVDIMRSLYKRLTEVENEDAYIGLKYAWMMHHAQESFDKQRLHEMINTLQPIMKNHYPYRMVLKMLLKPLSLNRTVVRLAMPILEQAARHLMFRSIH